ncbi:MAG: DNA repair exonuclease [Planctomycetaceae bacterium]|nr:DNA repair exonuclease [Planctomycetales bacterium]MCB9923054.1 DNA repair exonuclease [Planctomycetaceae bacterium]
MKFIHTADWQIGMKAAHVGAVGQVVRAERLEAARRVVEAAKSHDAEFIIVAGDTFEDNAVDRVVVQRVADILGSFSGPVYIISGNHDPLVPGAVWDHLAWQSHANLHVLTEAAPLQIEGATLYPCPLFEKHSLKDPTRWIDANDAPNIAIGIGHGTVEGVSQSELDYPIARDAATRAGLDYLGLGHWHSFASYKSSDGVSRMAYSGTHETTKFGERDSGNALLVEIETRGAVPKLTPIRTGGLSWKTITQRFSESGDAARLREQVEALPEPKSILLDLRIDGVLNQGDQVELARIDELLRARFLYGRVDTSQLVPRPDDNRWLEMLPVGVLRETAQRLQALSDPTYSEDRPEHASPAVATRALLELYRMVQEDNA